MAWKKALGMVGAAAMALSLAACGGANTGASTQKAGGNTEAALTVWSPQEDAQWLADQEKAFEKAHPEYKITWKNDVVSEGDAAKTVQQDPKAAADVYMFANDQLGTLVSIGAIGQLGENEAKQVTDQNDENIVKSVTGKDGKLYGVPFTGNTWFMYYNKAKVSDADAKSFDAMLAKAKVSFPLSNSWYVGAFYPKGADLTFFGDGTQADAGIKMDTAKAAEVTKYLAGVAANPNFVNDDKGSGLAGLKSGAVDVVFSGTWDAKNAQEALGANYAAATLPMFTVNGAQAQMQAFAGSKAIAYNPNSKNTKVAAQFAAFLGSKDAQKSHYDVRGIVPTDKSLAGSVKADDLAAKAQLETIAKNSVVQPTIAAMNNWWTPTEALGKGLVNKEVTAANAAEKTKAWIDGLVQAAK